MKPTIALRSAVLLAVVGVHLLTSASGSFTNRATTVAVASPVPSSDVLSSASAPASAATAPGLSESTGPSFFAATALASSHNSAPARPQGLAPGDSPGATVQQLLEQSSPSNFPAGEPTPCKSSATRSGWPTSPASDALAGRGTSTPSTPPATPPYGSRPPSRAPKGPTRQRDPAMGRHLPRWRSTGRAERNRTPHLPVRHLGAGPITDPHPGRLLTLLLRHLSATTDQLCEPLDIPDATPQVIDDRLEFLLQQGLTARQSRCLAGFGDGVPLAIRASRARSIMLARERDRDPPNHLQMPPAWPHRSALLGDHVLRPFRQAYSSTPA